MCAQKINPPKWVVLQKGKGGVDLTPVKDATNEWVKIGSLIPWRIDKENGSSCIGRYLRIMQ